MIRINLSSLAPPKTKRGKRSTAAVSVPGEGSSTVVLALFFVIVLAGLIGGSYWYVGRETTRLQKELRDANTENQRLAEVKAKYDESKRKSDMFERRVRVMNDLQAAQQVPIVQLNVIADTVNKTDAVWLETMTSDGKNLNLVGMALSADAVADLMANLRKSGQFKSVEIKETLQDSAVKEVQAFKFELICEMAFSNKVQKPS
jgi:Tfp pilus assembly protein PilN